MSDKPDLDDETLSLSALERIDQVCLKFEAAWKKGEAPSVEQYLGDTSDKERSRLLQELLLLELDYRSAQGEPPSLDGCRARFPEHSELITDVFRWLEASAAEKEETDREVVTLDAQETPPHEFGDYELLELIGEGGMGVVYRARQKSADRIVALKLIRPGRLAAVFPDRRREAIQRFRTEALAAARLEHDHIVTVYDVGQVDGQPFFSMRYVQGQSLDQVLRDGPFDGREAAALLEPVARAVHYAHQRHIVHRDLKPRNILLDADGRPYVVDFGLATSLEAPQEEPLSDTLIGTPAYMSPEQASRQTVGPASDVFSLGITLYEMLTGRSPFRQENLPDTLEMVRNREPPLPREVNRWIPRGLQLICLKCLAKAPSDRYASAAELADDLRRFAQGEALRVRPPSLVRRFWSWPRRRPALAYRLGALGVFYVWGTVVSLANTGSESEFNWGEFHGNLSVLMAAWAMASIVCQKFFESQRWSLAVGFAWGALDSAAFLTVLLMAHGAVSPLIIGYALLIAVSGFWFRERLVWYMTILSSISYGVLVVDYYCWRPEIHSPGQDDRHVIVVVALVIQGMSIAYLVRRVRKLTRFCGQ